MLKDDYYHYTIYSVSAIFYAYTLRACVKLHDISSSRYLATDTRMKNDANRDVDKKSFALAKHFTMQMIYKVRQKNLRQHFKVQI